MAAIRVLGFDGLIPRLSPTLLGDQFAQVATNVKLYAKELRYWRNYLPVYTPPPAAYQTLYRLFNSVTDDAVFLLWLTEVDVAVSPVADTTGESRIYYTGDGTPKKTNWAMATGGAEPYPSAWMEMGVPAPTGPMPGLGAPTLALTVSGTGVVETRSYVYTYVSTFGGVKAESAPSPPATIDVPSLGSTVTVSGFSAPPAGAYNITSKRIYRTVVGAESVNYELVEEIPIAQASYADSKTAAQIGPDLLPTIGWAPPPADLAGLVALPGGSLAGFVGNTVYFSVPYYPHAWPLDFGITLPVRKIVGLGVNGTSVVVMTSTNPYMIHGGVPGNMYTERLTLQEPCVAKTTIASDEDGVVYASPNGLIGISPGARGLLTTNLFTADEWRPLIPQTMHAAVLQGRYFGVFPNEVPSRALILSRVDPPALSYMTLPALTLHVDAVNGILFFVHDTDHRVYQLDADEITPMDYQWRSKRWFVDQAKTFSLLRVDADYSQIGDEAAYKAAYDKAVAWNAAHFNDDLLGAINSVPLNAFNAANLPEPETPGVEINGSILMNLPGKFSSRSLQINLYGDGNEQLANLSPTSLDPIRIPPFKSRELEIEILGNVDVRSLHMATTIEELKAS